MSRRRAVRRTLSTAMLVGAAVAALTGCGGGTPTTVDASEPRAIAQAVTDVAPAADTAATSDSVLVECGMAQLTHAGRRPAIQCWTAAGTSTNDWRPPNRSRRRCRASTARTSTNSTATSGTRCCCCCPASTSAPGSPPRCRRRCSRPSTNWPRSRSRCRPTRAARTRPRWSRCSSPSRRSTTPHNGRPRTPPRRSTSRSARTTPTTTTSTPTATGRATAGGTGPAGPTRARVRTDWNQWGQDRRAGIWWGWSGSRWLRFGVGRPVALPMTGHHATDPSTTHSWIPPWRGSR